MGGRHIPGKPRQTACFDSKENFSNLDIELVDGSYGTSMELKRRLKVKGLLIDKERERKIIIENSLGQPLVDRSYMLLK